MSLRWTQEQYDDFQARRSGYVPLSAHPRIHKGQTKADDEPEHKLQARIEKWCDERGFYHFHDRSRGDNRPGHPDLVIALAGRTLWLELKSRGGRLSPEQQKVILMLQYLGQEVHEVRSFKQFLDVVNGKGEGYLNER